MGSAVKGENKITMIPVYRISISEKRNLRKYSRKDLAALAKSIDQNGILNPIIVRDVSAFDYEIVSGERRLRAAVMAGKSEVPCIILHCNELQSAIYSLVENFQRVNSDYFDRAEALRIVIEDNNFSCEKAARHLGITEKRVREYLSLLTLDDRERKIISEHELTFSHALQISRVSSRAVRRRVLTRVINEELSATETEQLVFELISGKEDISRPIRKVVVKDMRLFYNTISNAVKTMKQSGIAAFMERSENDSAIEYRIIIAKPK